MFVKRLQHNRRRRIPAGIICEKRLYTRLFRDVPEDVFVGVFAFWPPATD